MAVGFEELTNKLNSKVDVYYKKAVCLSDKAGKMQYSYSINTDLDSYFDLASISKIVALSFLLHNLDKQKIDCHDSYLSIYKSFGSPIDTIEQLSDKSKERLNKISLESLLLHRSGIIEWYPFYTGESFIATLDMILKDTLPVEGMVYSDIGFMLIGILVSSLSRKTLPELLQELNIALGTGFFYNPPKDLDFVETEYGNQIEMGMCEERNLSFNPLPSIRSAWRDVTVPIKGQVNDGNAFYAMKGVSGHAGVFGRGSDILALCKLYNEAANGESRIDYISKAMAEYALKPIADNRCPGFNADWVFAPGVGHTGFTGTAIYINAATKVSTILLTNRLMLPGPPNIQSFRQQVFAILDPER